MTIHRVHPFTDETGQLLAAEAAKQTALLGAIAQTTPAASMARDMADVSNIVKLGLGPAVFPVGTQLIIPWTDARTSVATVWDMVWDVVHHADVTLRDGEVVPGMYIQSHYALPFATPFDAAEPDNADSNVKTYGSNCWATSNIRQFLNSASAAAKFGWTAQTATDVLSSSYDSLAGFMSGFGADFLAVVGETSQTTQRNNVDYSGSANDVLYDKFFLPSASQHYFNTYLGQSSATIEGEYWQYWKRVAGSSSPLAGWQTYPRLITYAMENHATACGVWLRSANRSYSYTAGFVYTDGTVNGTYAYHGLRCAPACVIV